MTEQKPVYSVTEHPDMSFAKIPHEDGMTYEFDLRQEVNPYLEKMFEKHHKAKTRRDFRLLFQSFGTRFL